MPRGKDGIGKYGVARVSHLSVISLKKYYIFALSLINEPPGPGYTLTVNIIASIPIIQEYLLRSHLLC